MYANHVPVIRDWALSSPHRFLGLGAFVLLTIRQPLRTVPGALRDVSRQGRESRWLFSAKRTGFQYLEQHATALLDEARACVAANDPERALASFAAVPSLGLAKAGFLAQCIGLPAGCLDSHNIARFGLSAGALRLPKTLTRASQAKRITSYLRLCDELGGAAGLWDSWCNYVADRQPSHYAGPFAVSQIHVTATQQWCS